MTNNIDFQVLAQRFDGPGVSAIVLLGSYARGDQGPYSDVDLVRLYANPPAAANGATHLIDGRLVVVSDVGPAQVEEWFTRPEVAVNVVSGLRTGRELVDREGAFRAIRIRARAFLWDSSIQQRANDWASQQMVGWIEEVHKGLEGLRSGDTGRLLHARFGCTWGLTRVMQVQRGVLVSGDNAFYDEVAAAMGRASEWVRLRQLAFGVEQEGRRPLSLRGQVSAGLRLYTLTAHLIAEALRPTDEPLITETVRLIEATLGTSPEANRHS